MVLKCIVFAEWELVSGRNILSGKMGELNGVGSVRGEIGEMGIRCFFGKMLCFRRQGGRLLIGGNEKV